MKTGEMWSVCLAFAITTISEGGINGTRTGYPGKNEKIAEFQKKSRKSPYY
jgi:hypothetical protein